MSTAALQARLKELSATLGQISPVIDRLRNTTSSADQGDEVRVELGAEIYAGLKDAEGELELLRVEVEALDTGSDNRRRTSVATGDKEAEKERVIAMAGRLADDFKRCVSVSRSSWNQIHWPPYLGSEYANIVAGFGGIFEVPSCKRREMPSWLGGRNASCCCPDPSRLPTAKESHQINSHKTTLCLMRQMMSLQPYVEPIT